MSGSANVNVNGRPALRENDLGVHAACCGTNRWRAQKGSATVFINGKGAFRMQDPTAHCGSMGQLVEGSADVLVGDGTSAGGAAAGGAGAGGGASGATGAAATGVVPATPRPTPAHRIADGAHRDPAARAPSGSHAERSPAGAAAQPAAELTFIEVRLVGEDGSPVANERWLLIPPDGEKRTGYTDAEGRVRVLALQPGRCRFSFPELDRDAWEPA